MNLRFNILYIKMPNRIPAMIKKGILILVKVKIRKVATIRLIDNRSKPMG